MNTPLTIVILSICLQLASALFAIRLVVITRRYGAGAFILATIFLMAFRRCISLYRLLNGSMSVDVFAELTGMTISLLVLIGILYITRLILSTIAAEKKKQVLLEELDKSSNKIKVLRGLLPICSGCKKIRDDSGYWEQIESYIKEHSEADFSHGLCPECLDRLYPEYRDNF